MTKGNYIRLDALCGCGKPVKLWSGRGRKTTRCEECSTPKPTGRRSAKVSKPCEYCGVLMAPALQSRAKKFCSIQCVGKSQRKHPDWNCIECGVMFSRRPGGDESRSGRNPSYCSVDCLRTARSRRSMERMEAEYEERAKRKAIRKIISVLRRISRTIDGREDGLCGKCGESYSRSKWQRKTECPDCSDKARRERVKEGRKIFRASPKGRAKRYEEKARRRARKRINSVPVDPIAILNRDGWRCQLCGVKTPKTKRGGFEDDAPEVDHIISLADGGAHAPHNLQCACRRCNLMKGAESRGQLRLM